MSGEASRPGWSLDGERGSGVTDGGVFHRYTPTGLGVLDEAQCELMAVAVLTKHRHHLTHRETDRQRRQH